MIHYQFQYKRMLYVYPSNRVYIPSDRLWQDDQCLMDGYMLRLVSRCAIYVCQISIMTTKYKSMISALFDDLIATLY